MDEWPHRESSDGGVWCESTNAFVTNCVIAGNPARYGGRAYGGTLNNCVLTGNSAGYDGGGAYRGTLSNCTLTGNSAFLGGAATGCTLSNCTLTGNSAQAYGSAGGGAWNCTLNNCIVYYNHSDNTSDADDNYASSILNHCCTTPLPANGVGNVTNAPLFVDYTGGNLRLQSNSPCIDAGHNAYASGSTDLAGNPRIARLRVDMGAYEYQGPGLNPFRAARRQLRRGIFHRAGLRALLYPLP